MAYQLSTPSQNGSGSDGNKGVFHIRQRSSITGNSPSDCSVSYPGHSLGEFYPSVEMQSVYSTSPADFKNCEELDKNSWTLSLPLSLSLYIYMYRGCGSKIWNIFKTFFFSLICPSFENDSINLNFHDRLYYSSTFSLKFSPIWVSKKKKKKKKKEKRKEKKETT